MLNSILLNDLLAAASARDVATVLAALGDGPQVKLNEPFGPHGLSWRALGGTISNSSTVHLASAPGRALMERVTNSIDAVVEDHLRRMDLHNMPVSFRDAGEVGFGRPASGPHTGMFEWRHGSSDQAVQMVLRDSTDETRPTVDVYDAGTGLTAAEMPRTILSLQGGNKISKFYLAGTFGQGGSATFAFCAYTLIVSKPRGKDPGGFTVVREIEMGAHYKENVYAYLADESGAILPLENAAAIALSDLPPLAHGTLVRHFDYLLKDLVGPLVSYPGNMYHFSNWAMFDPLLPWRLIDARARYTEDRKRNEIITGARNRLLKLVSKPSRELGSEMAHYVPLEYIKPAGGERASVGVEYWVVFSRKKSNTAASGAVLRARSNLLFVPQEHPIVYTYNGQTQGYETNTLLKDVGLAALSQHMVIHIDATNVQPRVRRELFTTTRESIKTGPVKDSILEALRHILAKDTRLQALEQELAEERAKSQLRVANSQVQRQVIALMKNAGYATVGKEVVESRVKGSGRDIVERLSHELGEGSGELGEGSGEGGENSTSEGAPVEFAVSPFPEVKEWHFDQDGPLEIEGGGKVTTVSCITDADLPEFLSRGLVSLDSGGLLEVVSEAPLPGRMRWRVRVPASGDLQTMGGTMGGLLTAAITDLSGRMYKADIAFSIIAPREKAGSSKVTIPPFEIFAISPRDDAWTEVWSSLNPATCSEAELQQVAFKPLKAGRAVYIYYSTVFKDFLAADLSLQRAGNATALETFRTQYQIWCAYYGVLEEMEARPLEGINETAAEQLAEAQRGRVGSLIVKQALMMTKILMSKARGVTVDLEAEAAA